MSFFLWIDHSERQRRQILEAVDLFRERDTRDELGIAGIRDALADLMFPGTGSLQTRARYFLFVPWMYRQLEVRRSSAGSIAKAARDFEIRLIDTLAESTDTDGTIGILARAALQRVPSSIYWNGLKVLGICRYSGSQSDFHRDFDRLTARRRTALRNDDGELVPGTETAAWSMMPEAPAGFPHDASFALTRAEAGYLRERVLEHHPASLFAHLLRQPHDPRAAAFVWEDPVVAAIGPELARQLRHARNFSELMVGAPILYNLLLAKLEPVRGDVKDTCEQLLAEWGQSVERRRADYDSWDRVDFWNLVRETGASLRQPTRDFVDEWLNLALGPHRQQLKKHQPARDLIVRRERALKGSLARFDNRRAREVWRGEAGLGRIDYRWTNARRLLIDIFAGLEGIHARSK